MLRNTSGVSTRLLWRWAHAIHEHRRNNPVDSDTYKLPDATWRRAEDIIRKLKLASARGWTLVAKLLRRNMQSALRELQAELADCERALDAMETPACQASVADLFREIVALHTEFDEVVFEFQVQTLSVVTEPIELEGVYLGPFEIMLNWGRKTGDLPHAYSVIAREPNPAYSNSQVTHPHVQDERLCEGDGASPIRQALKEGRLFDFFLVVANLLRTYNSESPYVSLDDWLGVACSDCGSAVSEHDYWSCVQCGSQLCDDCRFGCLSCTDTYCSDCIKRCAACEDAYCKHCIKTCSDCDEEFCSDCVCDDGRCEKCHETASEPEQESEEEPHAETTSEKSTGVDPADAPVQPNCVGEIIVSA